jgi:hypothetical protein
MGGGRSGALSGAEGEDASEATEAPKFIPGKPMFITRN